MLRPKRLGILALFPLILLAPSFLNATNAQNDEKARNAKALLDIVEEANAGVKETFDELESAGILVPDEAAELYREGSESAEEASNLIALRDYPGASSAAVEALQRFKDALRIVYRILPKTPDEAEVIAERIISLKVTVNRVYEYVKRLEQLTARAQDAGHNCTTLKKLIYEAEIRLEKAYEKLDGLDIEGASRELASFRSLLNQSVVLYRRLRSSVKLAKAEVFLTEAEARFTVLKANITAASLRLPEEEKNATLVALNKALYRLQNARVLMEATQVDETIEELMEYKERLKESLKYVQSVQAELVKHD